MNSNLFSSGILMNMYMYMYKYVPEYLWTHVWVCSEIHIDTCISMFRNTNGHIYKCVPEYLWTHAVMFRIPEYIWTQVGSGIIWTHTMHFPEFKHGTIRYNNLKLKLNLFLTLLNFIFPAGGGFIWRRAKIERKRVARPET